MNSQQLSDMLLRDPNPTEEAECSLTILSRPEQEVSGDHILGEMVRLYNHKSSFALICKALDELVERDQALIYVGTREKCELWAEIFRKMDLIPEIENI